MKKKKYFLIISAALMISMVGLAITKIAGKKMQVDGKRNNVATEQVDHEVPTNDDAWKELGKIVDAYYSGQGIRYKGTMRLIDENEEKEKLLEEMSFEYVLFGDDYYYQLGQVEVVSRKDLLLAVDNASRTVALAHNPEDAKQKQIFSPEQIKKLLEEKDATATVTQSGAEKILAIDNINDPSVQGYRIYYSPGTYRVHKIEIGMVRLQSLTADEESRETEVAEEGNENKTVPETEDQLEIETYTYFLEVNYSETEILSMKSGDFRPEEKFIRMGNNHVQLTTAYSNYTLVNTADQQ